MNINKVYLAYIYQKTSSKKVPGVELYHEKADFIKKALICDRTSRFDPYYIDLVTKRKYYAFGIGEAEVGELFINMEQGIIPLENIIEVNKKNMSRKKILEKYKNR